MLTLSYIKSDGRAVYTMIFQPVLSSLSQQIVFVRYLLQQASRVPGALRVGRTTTRGPEGGRGARILSDRYLNITYCSEDGTSRTASRFAT